MEKKYVIWITLSNGKTYYLCGDRLGLYFLSIREDKFLFTNFKSLAKRYTLQGAKGMVTKLWNKTLPNFDKAFEGERIVHTSYIDINTLEKEVKSYPNEWDYFFRQSMVNK